MPGPNDHHVKFIADPEDPTSGKKVPVFHPGLGADEPKKLMTSQRGVTSAERAAFDKEKADLEKARRELAKREQALARIEAQTKGHDETTDDESEDDESDDTPEG